MKFLFDFFPIVFFYVTYQYMKNKTGDEIEGMIYATVVLIIATLIQMTYTFIKHKKFEKMHVITLVLVLLFGGATIYFREGDFLVWKVTLVNWLFALVFLGSHFIGKTLIIKRMMQHAIEMPEHAWKQLSYMWIGFFIGVGILNLIVRKYVGFDTWVDFKLFGMLGLTLVFIILQAFYLAKHIKETPKNSEES